MIARFLCFIPRLLSATLVAAASAHAADLLVYFGTSTNKTSSGIYVSHFDPEKGVLSPAELAAKTTQPLFINLHPNHRFLYAIGERKKEDGAVYGTVEAFTIEPATGKLAFLNHQPAGGGPLCYVAIDKTGGTALAVSYREGYVTSLRLKADGTLGENRTFVRHSGSSVHERQKGPHAHCIDLDPANRFALVADLGLDKVYTYRFDPATSALTQEPEPFQTKPGAGPRHIAFDASGQHVYLVNEIDSTLSVLSYDPVHGRLTERQVLSLLPADCKDPSSAAEVVVHPSGKYVYASNRGYDSLALFSVAPDTGLLTFVEYMREGIKHPRHFAIDPSGRWLLCANRDADTVTVYRIDPETGRLTATASQANVSMPTCVQFFAP